ncbi:MAG: hypothetical protein QOF83_582 [Solirubrobacteraceae bacterium]|nr:hypothetical protein [Solirubrobacteraceae bacterium]
MSSAVAGDLIARRRRIAHNVTVVSYWLTGSAVRRGFRFVGVALAVLAVSACGGGSHRPARRPGSAVRRASGATGVVGRLRAGGVAFIIGASTDPYGDSRPRGFGVASGLIGGRLHSVEVSARRGPFAVTWLGIGRLGSESFDGHAAAGVLYAVGGGRLVWLGGLPLRPGEDNFVWSPNRTLIATQRSVRVSCGPGVTRRVARAGCTAPGRTIVVERADGSYRHPVATGLFLTGWAADGRLVLFNGNDSQFGANRYVTLELRSGRRRTVLFSGAVAGYAHARHAALDQLAYSADGRYLAALALLSGFPGAAKLPLGAERVIVIARSDGSIVRLITSTDVISMFAWSPRGDQLAYTTSGFPVPHELYVLRRPRARPWRILSQSDHFDWVTWSPDDRWLLIDNEHQHAWELLRLSGHQQARIFAGAAVPTRRLARLGGQPLWCCPQDHYGGS